MPDTATGTVLAVATRLRDEAIASTAAERFPGIADIKLRSTNRGAGNIRLDRIGVWEGQMIDLEPIVGDHPNCTFMMRCNSCGHLVFTSWHAKSAIDFAARYTTEPVTETDTCFACVFIDRWIAKARRVATKGRYANLRFRWKHQTTPQAIIDSYEARHTNVSA